MTQTKINQPSPPPNTRERMLEIAERLFGQNDAWDDSAPTAEEEIVTARFSTDRVVKAGLVTPSRSCGTAMEFALSLVRDLFGDAKVAEINKGVLAKI